MTKPEAHHKQSSLAMAGQDLKKSVLIVEDDRTHRSLMEKILAECGFSVVPAEDGFVALSRLDSGQVFDLIIMDWDMPGIDGLETVRKIRARQAGGEISHVPVLAFTAHKNPGDREKCLAAGMDAYLPKDVWMPKWRQTLIDNLQGLINGDFKPQDLEPLEVENICNDGSENFALDLFDQQSLEQTAALLKSELSIAVEEYLEDAAAYIRDIKAGFEKNDAEKIARGSHPLKSNSKGFGLTSVSKLSEAINTKALKIMEGSGDLDDIRSLLPKLEQAFYEAEQWLSGALKRNGF